MRLEVEKLSGNTINEINRFLKVWEDVIKEDRNKFEELEIHEYTQFFYKWNDTFLEFVKMADNTEEDLEELQEININEYIKW